MVPFAPPSLLLDPKPSRTTRRLQIFLGERQCHWAVVSGFQCFPAAWLDEGFINLSATSYLQLSPHLPLELSEEWRRRFLSLSSLSGAYFCDISSDLDQASAKLRLYHLFQLALRRVWWFGIWEWLDVAFSFCYSMGFYCASRFFYEKRRFF